MSLFTRFLSRRPGSTRLPPAPAANPQWQSNISNTINNALAAAGLPEIAKEPLHPAKAALPAPVQRPAGRPRARPHRALPETGSEAGSFSEHTFSNSAGSRTYKLYLPAGYVTQPPARYPLVLMLHGCTQSPDDFAAGTRMNALADQHGFLVAYPAQSPNANGSKCWNWFRPGDQMRDAGEPAVLAGLTRQLIETHAVDPQRIFVAGLSAGAAMAVILGTTWPELFAAVGAHSGLPYRAARDVPSAFAAMGGTHALREVDAETDAQARRSGRQPAPVIPLIVFHGDADHTVAPANGEALVRQTMGAASALLPESRAESVTGSGRRCTRSVYTTSLGDPLVEYWQLHGAGHAWSGGSTMGSYTDPQGPDASAEMVRFFLQAGPQSRHPD